MPFNLGAGELLVIALVALIVLGPDKLPAAARNVGRMVSEFRRMSSGFQAELRDALKEPVDGTPVGPPEARVPEPPDRPAPPTGAGALARPARGAPPGTGSRSPRPPGDEAQTAPAGDGDAHAPAAGEAQTAVPAGEAHTPAARESGPASASPAPPAADGDGHANGRAPGRGPGAPG